MAMKSQTPISRIDRRWVHIQPAGGDVPLPVEPPEERNPPVARRNAIARMHQRRLVRDYETTESSALAWIYIAMIRIQLRRLA